MMSKTLTENSCKPGCQCGQWLFVGVGRTALVSLLCFCLDVELVLIVNSQNMWRQCQQEHLEHLVQKFKSSLFIDGQLTLTCPSSIASVGSHVIFDKSFSAGFTSRFHLNFKNSNIKFKRSNKFLSIFPVAQKNLIITGALVRRTLQFGPPVMTSSFYMSGEKFQQILFYTMYYFSDHPEVC